MICALPDVAFAWQPPSKASVSVLDGTFLPGTGGVAKPRLGSDLGLEMWPTDKLGSAVKSDGPTGDEGKIFDGTHDLAHDRLGAPVRVFQDHGEAAEALNQ